MGVCLVISKVTPKWWAVFTSLSSWKDMIVLARSFSRSIRSPKVYQTTSPSLNNRWILAWLRETSVQDSTPQPLNFTLILTKSSPTATGTTKRALKFINWHSNSRNSTTNWCLTWCSKKVNSLSCRLQWIAESAGPDQSSRCSIHFAACAKKEAKTATAALPQWKPDWQPFQKDQAVAKYMHCWGFEDRDGESELPDSANQEHSRDRYQIVGNACAGRARSIFEAQGFSTSP